MHVIGVWARLVAAGSNVRRINAATAGVTGVDGAFATVTTDALDIPCTVKDDDDNTLLPRFPDTSQLGPAYQDAYVVPVFDVGDNNPAVPFVLNLQANISLSTVIDWDSRAMNATDFWVAYLLGAYQDDTTEDYDPNDEASKFGITLVGGGGGVGGSLVYLEVHQTHEGIGNPMAEEQDTVVHETGHAVANSNAEDVTNGASRFISDYLTRIRSGAKPAS